MGTDGESESEKFVLSARLDNDDHDKIGRLLGSEPLIRHTVHVQLLVGARGVIVIVVGNGHGDTSSNPG